MDLIAECVEVWATSIEDKPGSLANVLTGLREAGADLNFILARRAPEAFGKAEVFVTPLQGDVELGAAATLLVVSSVAAAADAPPVPREAEAGAAALVGWAAVIVASVAGFGCVAAILAALFPRIAAATDRQARASAPTTARPLLRVRHQIVALPLLKRTLPRCRRADGLPRQPQRGDHHPGILRRLAGPLL